MEEVLPCLFDRLCALRPGLRPPPQLHPPLKFKGFLWT
jgi:hypothetical protein